MVIYDATAKSQISEIPIQDIEYSLQLCLLYIVVNFSETDFLPDHLISLRSENSQYIKSLRIAYR